MNRIVPRPPRRDADRRSRRLATALVAGLTGFQGLALCLGGGWIDALPPDERPATPVAALAAEPPRIVPSAPPGPGPAADPRDQAAPWSFDADGHARLRP